MEWSQGSKPAAQQTWVDQAVHNIGAPINTKWDEGELSFADDGTMVLTSSRQDLAVAPGDPKDLYIATFNRETGTWNMPVNTAGSDMCPAIGPQGKTFCWFASRPDNTLGAADIYWTAQSNIDRVLNAAK